VQQLHSATLRARAPGGVEGGEGSQQGEGLEGVAVAGGDLGLIECLCGVYPRPLWIGNSKNDPRNPIEYVSEAVRAREVSAYADVELCIDLDAAHEVRPCLWSETLRFLRRKVHSKHAK
jgi:hypothetical protein